MDFNNEKQKKAYAHIFNSVPTHKTTSRLTTFLYLLMRNSVPPGIVASLSIEALEGSGEMELSNGYLGQFAEHLAHKLTKHVIEEPHPGDEQDLDTDSFRSRQKGRDRKVGEED